MVSIRILRINIPLQDRFVPLQNAFMERVWEKAFLAPLLCAILLQRDYMFRMQLYHYDK